MFDIGFFELVLVGVIALLVLGPERLPHAVRMTGAWIGKIRRASLAIREEFEREVNAQEMKKRIEEQIEQAGLKDAQESLEDMREAMRKNIVEQQLFDTEKEDFGKLKKDLEQRLTVNESNDHSTDHQTSQDQPKPGQPNPSQQ